MRNLVDAGNARPESRFTTIKANPTASSVRLGRTSSAISGQMARSRSDGGDVGLIGCMIIRCDASPRRRVENTGGGGLFRSLAVEILRIRRKIIFRDARLTRPERRCCDGQ